MVASRVERRLAAVLVADVVSYSRFMEQDEAGTLERLKAHRRELIDPLLADHRGRVVKLMGDGALVEFASVVDAVACAVLIQRGMAEREGDVPEEQRIRFRIGVNLGDIIREPDGDLYGDGVNVAARLEGVAEPGGVCVSGTAYDHLQGKLDCTFESLGERALKNIERPVRVYRVAPEAGASSGLAVARPTDKPSIAVLPFTNMSGDPEQEYFADGLTEDIITDLAKISALFVVARATAFTYKGRPTDVEQVSRELRVSSVLEGSVRKGANRVRVTAQLIDGRSGRHLWAERYDRSLTDIFEVQDEIAHSIVNALKISLLASERRAISRVQTTSVEAYQFGFIPLKHVRISVL